MTYPPPYGQNEPDPTRAFPQAPYPGNQMPPGATGPQPQPGRPAPAYGPPPGFYPPQQPPRRKKGALIWTIAAGGGVLALCMIVGIIQGLSGSGTRDQNGTADDAAGPTTKAGAAAAPTTHRAAKPAAVKPKTPGLKTPVRDGKFEFVVNGVDCGTKTVGNQLLNEKAQGRFCLVDVMVRNIGTEEQMFDGSSQKAFDAKGTEYSNDTAAELYANDGTATFLEDINPGNHVRGKLVFDVPTTVVLTELELHDSPFSGGVKVSLK